MRRFHLSKGTLGERESVKWGVTNFNIAARDASAKAGRALFGQVPPSSRLAQAILLNSFVQFRVCCVLIRVLEVFVPRRNPDD